MLVFSCTHQEKSWTLKQLTSRENINHDLDNNLNFSPDNQWICYDTRPLSGIGETRSIERVNIISGEIKTIYEAPQADKIRPGVGAVSYFPNTDRVVFIHGFPNLPYEKYRRFGAIVDIPADKMIVADARDVTFPYTKGALRGGTHRHEPGGFKGEWLGFTYNDMIMQNLGKDLRTIGVTRLNMPVTVDKDENGENQSGTGFSVLVVRVTDNPKAGSDEISHAASDSWVGGEQGYRKPDGSRQMARAFIGKLADGKDEVFIVDIPQDITKQSEWGPLEGTETSFPMPPEGTVQRRLTHTESGCGGTVRSAPDGKWISFLSSDRSGKLQIFIISPNGGDPIQVTSFKNGISAAPYWHFSGKYFVFPDDKGIYIVTADPDNPEFKQFFKIPVKFDATPSNVLWSNDGKYIGFNLGNQESKQIYVITTDSMFWKK
jgi:hypothetical protein